MSFSYHKSPIRLWWRRQQLFRYRRISFIWFIFVFICILIVPNPFSAEYSRIAINQDIQWNSINETLQIKEQILQNEIISDNSKVVKRGIIEEQSTSPILIVLFTTIFRDKKFCSFSIERIFGKTCPSKNRCQWSCDHEKFREADALIFHAYDIPLSRAPIPNRSETKPNAVWILWSDEPPTIINYGLLKSYHFNWTISYKLNSEVSIGSYGLFSRRIHPLSDNTYQDWIEKEYYNRTNGALWFVSNCHSKKRLEIFYKLKYASNLLNEGYGRCVDYYPIHLCSSFSQCEYNYMSKFKFYLSFESNTCRDYITEKFYKAFYYGVIPIVYGPKRNDYERLAPKNSFIHIDDFHDDIDKLADYMKEIHSNLTLFSMYHQWRKNYEVIIDGKALERIRMCELCQRLSNLRKDDMIYYENIENFYNDGCR
ncbi:unnamed protein product [Adineta steineri]|uniref:Fucosyltransferase n=1 Tax=Adineta steineri TaxID=433720 RepID=A0A814JEV5_9BILA|nr:unnamed protein product [Adineta steineri]CAF3812946.1 unnamed protein product [Adineta steineri]